MDKYLIINADDFGMCHSHNVAVMDLFQNGLITSSTSMAPCSWATEACRFAKQNPQYAIGVHLTMTSEWGSYRWAPVGQGPNTSLRESDGYMHHESDQVENLVDLKEVRDELVAQIEKCKALGLNPSHLDNHMGSLYGIETGRFELLNVVFDVAGEYGLPFRFPANIPDAAFDNSMLDIKIPKEQILGLLGQLRDMATSKGVAIPDYLIPNEWGGEQDKSYENFKEYIFALYSMLPNGVTETYLHPSAETDEVKGITSTWQKRVWEYQLMKDPQTKQHLDALGIQLINYRDLAEMKK